MKIISYEELHGFKLEDFERLSEEYSNFNYKDASRSDKRAFTINCKRSSECHDSLYLRMRPEVLLNHLEKSFVLYTRFNLLSECWLSPAVARDKAIYSITWTLFKDNPVDKITIQELPLELLIIQIKYGLTSRDLNNLGNPITTGGHINTQIDIYNELKNRNIKNISIEGIILTRNTIIEIKQGLIEAFRHSEDMKLRFETKIQKLEFKFTKKPTSNLETQIMDLNSNLNFIKHNTTSFMRNIESCNLYLGVYETMIQEIINQK